MGFRNFRGIFGEFLAKKEKKITGFENIEILDIGGSIRYTLRHSEKFRDIGIREFLDTIFSSLVRRGFILFLLLYLSNNIIYHYELIFVDLRSKLVLIQW